MNTLGMTPRAGVVAILAAAALTLTACGSTSAGSSGAVAEAGTAVAAGPVTVTEQVTRTVPVTVTEQVPTTVTQQVPTTVAEQVPATVAPQGPASPTTPPPSQQASCTQTQSWTTSAASVGFPATISMVPLDQMSVSSGQCADTIRITFSQTGAAYGYEVKYVPQVTSQGRGQPLGLSGGAKLQVTINAPAYDVNTGTQVFQMNSQSNIVDVSSLAAVQQVAWGGSFEAQTTFGIGVDTQRPFSVDVSNGTLSITIAH